MITKDNRGIGDRFADILKSYGYNANSFAAEVGGTTAKYYKLLNGKSKPDYDTIYSVLNKFPEISAEWLMRGEGPMKKSAILSKEDAESLIAENRVIKTLLREEMKSMTDFMGKTKVPTKSSDSRIFRRKEDAKKTTSIVRKGGIGLVPGPQVYSYVTHGQSGRV